MIDLSKLEIGSKVHFNDRKGKVQNGMVKVPVNLKAGSVRVVYNCDGQWDNFRDYTSELTNLIYLQNGWIED